MNWHIVWGCYYLIAAGGVFASSFSTMKRRGIGWAPLFLIVSAVWPLWAWVYIIYSEMIYSEVKR